jgi:DNA-binding HxlR family transcriptional regulator
MKDGTSASPTNSCDSEEAPQVRQVLDRVGDKWSILVISRLDRGPRRFTELQRATEGISQRMLTLTLRQLERDGLVGRTVHAVVPPRVDYELTELGRTVLVSVHSLITWAIEHRSDIAAARAHYDARRSSLERAAVATS